jgi:hypothetical protein
MFEKSFYMHRPNAALLVSLTFLFVVSAAANAQQPFVHGSDIRFSIVTDRRSYNVGDQIIIHYTIKNVSNGALYVPAAQWEIKCGNNPHLWSRLEDRSGKHYEPGYGGSCGSPNPIDQMSLSERMRKDALLLKPGQTVTGSFTLDSSVFDGSLKPGAYRLEAVLYGWNQRYDNSQLSELAEMGAPLLIGDSNASMQVELTERGK